MIATLRTFCSEGMITKHNIVKPQYLRKCLELTIFNGFTVWVKIFSHKLESVPAFQTLCSLKHLNMYELEVSEQIQFVSLRVYLWR